MIIAGVLEAGKEHVTECIAKIFASKLCIADIETLRLREIGEHRTA